MELCLVPGRSGTRDSLGCPLCWSLLALLEPTLISGHSAMELLRGQLYQEWLDGRFCRNRDGADMTNESKSSSWPEHRSSLLSATAMGFSGCCLVASSMASRAVEHELPYRRGADAACAGFELPLILGQIRSVLV